MAIFQQRRFDNVFQIGNGGQAANQSGPVVLQQVNAGNNGATLLSPGNTVNLNNASTVQAGSQPIIMVRGSNMMSLSLLHLLFFV